MSRIFPDLRRQPNAATEEERFQSSQFLPMQRHRLTAWTPRSKADAEALYADIVFNREHGRSLIVEEIFLDIVSIRVAFASPVKARPMALSVSIPSASVGQIAAGVQSLTEVACKIGNMNGNLFWSKRQPSTDLQANNNHVRDYTAKSSGSPTYGELLPVPMIQVTTAPINAWDLEAERGLHVPPSTKSERESARFSFTRP